MKDLLNVDDVFNLQKNKKEYDDVMIRINRYYRKGGSFVEQKPVLNKRAPYSDLTEVKFKNKINPLHMKYYKEFKNPVHDNNFLMYKEMVREELEDSKYANETPEDKFTSAGDYIDQAVTVYPEEVADDNDYHDEYTDY